MLWYHVKYNYFEVILKLFQSIILHVTTSETEIKLSQVAEGVLKLFQNYFSDSEKNIQELQWACEIILK